MNGFEGLMEDQRGVRDAKAVTGTKKRENLIQAEARRLFDYDPETGLLTRLVTCCNTAKAGMIVGSIGSDGYPTVTVNYYSYKVHRIIWLWWYGYFPDNQIDHINRVRNDNRICNLREVTQTHNRINTGLPSNNSSGVKGVNYNKVKGWWVATIYTKGNGAHYLGMHDDFIEAVAHRLAAEDCLGWEEWCHDSSARQYMQDYLRRLPEDLCSPKVDSAQPIPVAINQNLR